MIELKYPLSQKESAILIDCLAQLENQMDEGGITGFASGSRLINRATVSSARSKLETNTMDRFRREEITNMIFALDGLSRQCNRSLDENAVDAENIGSKLVTAASARAKLRTAAGSTVK